MTGNDLKPGEFYIETSASKKKLDQAKIEATQVIARAMEQDVSSMTPEEAQRIISGQPTPVETIIDFPAPSGAWIKAVESGLIQSVKFSMRGGQLQAVIEHIPQLAEARIAPGIAIPKNEDEKS
ncbi:hypothetical protein [Hyphomicrobium sp. MC8b]|uniref:hypothetical protein n=1 Tax=Hyphomicrobium sp. MC8b TaxID=300273 RepID=UPI00391A2697